MACCAAAGSALCACALVGDGTTIRITGIGTIAQPFVATALTVGPTGATGTAGTNGTNGTSNLTFPQVPAFSNIDRVTATSNAGPTNQNGQVYGFVAPMSLTVGHVTVYLVTADAAVTVGQIALYSVASNGDLTQVAATGNVASSFTSGAPKQVISAFAASVAIVAGNAYALSVYFNGGAPVFAGALVNGSQAFATGIKQPFHSARTAASVSVPGASITFASLNIVAAVSPVYAEFTA